MGSLGPPMLTPWRTVRTEFTNATREREKRWLVFGTMAGWASPQHLTESEFAHAMVSAPQFSRSMYEPIPEIDTNERWIDADEFLRH